MSEAEGDEVPTSAPAAVEEPLRLHRPAGLALLLPGFALLLLVGAVVVGPEPLRGALESAAEGLPFGGLPVVTGTLGALMLLPIALFVASLYWVTRRFGRCELYSDRAVFQLQTAGGSPRLVPLSLVVGHRRTAHGLILQVQSGKGSFTVPIAAPLLIPIDDDRQLTAVLEVLAASEMRREEGERRVVFGSTMSALFQSGVALSFLALAAVPAAGVAMRFGVDSGFLALLSFFGLHTAAGFVYFVWFRSLRVTVHSSAQELAFAQRRFPYSELRRVSVTDGAIAVEDTKGRRDAAWLPDGWRQASALLRERVASVGGDPDAIVKDALPSWATRRMSWQRAALLLLPSVFTWLACMTLAFESPSYGSLCVSDPAGTLLQIVFDGDSDRPPRLITAEADLVAEVRVTAPGLWSQTLGDPESKVWLDFARGVGSVHSGIEFSIPSDTTWVHLDPSGEVRFGHPRLVATEALRDACDQRRTQGDAERELIRVVTSINLRVGRSQTPVFRDDALGAPQALAGWLRHSDDPALRAWVRGESSRRCVLADDSAGRRLVWGVDRGRVIFVAITTKAAAFKIARDVGYKQGRGGPTLTDPAQRSLRLANDGSVLAASGSSPSFEDLWAATEKIKGGAAVEDAVRSLLPELWR